MSLSTYIQSLSPVAYYRMNQNSINTAIEQNSVSGTSGYTPYLQEYNRQIDTVPDEVQIASGTNVDRDGGSLLVGGDGDSLAFYNEVSGSIFGYGHMSSNPYDHSDHSALDITVNGLSVFFRLKTPTAWGSGWFTYSVLLGKGPGYQDPPIYGINETTFPDWYIAINSSGILQWVVQGSDYYGDNPYSAVDYRCALSLDTTYTICCSVATDPSVGLETGPFNLFPKMYVNGVEPTYTREEDELWGVVIKRNSGLTLGAAAAIDDMQQALDGSGLAYPNYNVPDGYKISELAIFDYELSPTENEDAHNEAIGATTEEKDVSFDSVYSLAVRENHSPVLDVVHGLSAASVLDTEIDTVSALVVATVVDTVVDVEYVLNGSIVVAFQFESDQESLIPFQFAALTSESLSFQFLSFYSMYSDLPFQFMSKQDISDTTQVPFQFESYYNESVPFQFESKQSLTVDVPFQAQINQVFAQEVPFQILARSEILDIDKVAFQFKSVQQSIDANLYNVTDVPYIMHDNKRVEITAANVSTDEDSLGWTGTIYIANLSDYFSFVQDEEFTLNLYGEEYNFVVDNKSLNRSEPEGYQAVLNGVSPVMRHVQPRSSPYSKIWGGYINAKDAAEEAIGDTINWTTVDWSLPGNVLSITDGDPIQIAQRLAEAVGAVVISDPDGTIIVQPRFTHDVPQWSSAVASFVLTELDDIFTISENFVPGKIVNELTISNTDNQIRDRVEWEQDDDGLLSGKLFAYPVPWRDSQYVDLQTTAEGGRIALSRDLQKVSYRTEPDQIEGDETVLVEIVEGEGSVGYPIYSIDYVEWLSDPIGLAYVRGDSILRATDENAQYGLLRIKYTVRYQGWRATSNVNKEAQVIMYDLRA